MNKHIRGHLTNIIDLRQQALRECPIGTHVITPKGFTWELLDRQESGETWKDITSGLTWVPIEPSKMNHYTAIKTQSDLKRIPTKNEFQEAEKHGIREVLDKLDHKWFWSASVNPNIYDEAYYFDGTYGDINSGYRYSDNGSSLCVALQKDGIE